MYINNGEDMDIFSIRLVLKINLEGKEGRKITKNELFQTIKNDMKIADAVKNVKIRVK